MDALEDLLYNRSGLLGASGISGDMRVLLASAEPRAAEAVRQYSYRIRREVGSLAAALGGLDVLIFTGGIGENAAPIRSHGAQLKSSGSVSNWLRPPTRRARARLAP